MVKTNASKQDKKKHAYLGRKSKAHWSQKLGGGGVYGKISNEKHNELWIKETTVRVKYLQN